MTDADLKNIPHKLYAAFSAADLLAVDALVSDTYIEHEETPGITPNREGLKQFVVMLSQAFPDVAYEVADSAVDRDKVWTRVIVTGTHRGPWFGVPPTGRATRIQLFDICRIADGKIVEHWGLSDHMGLMRQLGVIPNPGS
jgi:predicted ester cyclase